MKIKKTVLESEIINKHLAKLELLIDPEHIQRTKELQKKAFNFEDVTHIPTVINYPIDNTEWPNFSFKEIFDDPGKMLLHELKSVYASAKLQDDGLYGIRANYGTGIIASMFGCETETFENTLPIALHIDDQALLSVLDNGIPALTSGLMGKVYETALYFQEMLSPYPKLSEFIDMELFDTQGTFDNASIIWGSEIFFSFYDNPEKLHSLMRIITETIKQTVCEFRRISDTPIEEQGGRWNSLGAICLRNDSCINLSREQYIEFVKPYDQELISELSGWIHFCGKAQQWWDSLLDIPNLKGINPYQGEFYDLCEMFEICETRKIPIMQWTTPLNEKARKMITTGFSVITAAASFAEAQHLKNKLFIKKD